MVLIKIKKIKRFILLIIFAGAVSISALTGVSAAEITDDEMGEIIDSIIEAVSPSITIGVDGFTSPEGVADSVNILIFLTIIALAPSILVLMTGFTRILIVLSFVRSALGLQQTPPNQVLIGIALFLTVFLMAPVFSQMNDEALQPYINGELSLEEAGSAVKIQ